MLDTFFLYFASESKHHCVPKPDYCFYSSLRKTFYLDLRTLPTFLIEKKNGLKFSRFSQQDVWMSEKTEVTQETCTRQLLVNVISYLCPLKIFHYFQ